MKIAGVVLAAGGSSRLGSPKQLLQFRGQSFLRHAAQTALAAGLDPVVIVLGAAADRMALELAGLNVQAVLNLAWSTGMGSSLRVGIGALGADVDAALVTLCDLPLVDSAALAKLAGAFLETANAETIVAAAYDGGVGAPAVFGQPYFAELLQSKGDQGARRLLRTYRERVIVIPVPFAAADIDTGAQYESLPQT